MSCPFSGTTDPFSTLQIPVQYAKLFSLSIAPYTATLTYGSSTLVLSACNNPNPPANSLKVPVSFVSITGDSVLGFVERLGKLNTVSRIVKEVATSACALGLSQAALASNTSVSSATFGSGGIDVSALIAQEASPLARADWLTFFDAFYAFQGNSPSVLKQIQTKYQCVAQKVTAYRNTGGGLPTVLVAQADLSSNNIVAVSNPSFWRVILTDAGAIPQFAVDKSTFLTLAKTADVLLEVTPDLGVNFDIALFSKVYGLKSEDPGYPFLGGFNSQVWRYDRRTASGYDDYFQSGPSQPDILLQDLLEIWSPKYNPSASVTQSYFMRNIFYDASYHQVMYSECPADASLVIPAVPCTDSNKFLPSIGRFASNNAGGSGGGSSDGSTTGTPTPNNTSGSGGFNLAALVGSLFAVALFLLLIFYLYRKYGHLVVTGPGNQSWIQESVQKRRFFRMVEEDEDRLQRQSGIELETRRGQGKGRVGWRREGGGMPVLDGDE
ncbi:hypothetical protein HDU79_009482 [Rhizoclosmatium sp. JEL0117]|nr:hypothetical protein HDU79_009482 [Rhizoclosmatium sp. JEL0117]